MEANFVEIPQYRRSPDVLVGEGGFDKGGNDGRETKTNDDRGAHAGAAPIDGLSGGRLGVDGTVADIKALFDPSPL